jgi:hypothetical protein
MVSIVRFCFSPLTLLSISPELAEINTKTRILIARGRSVIRKFSSHP